MKAVWYTRQGSAAEVLQFGEQPLGLRILFAAHPELLAPVLQIIHRVIFRRRASPPAPSERAYSKRSSRAS